MQSEKGKLAFGAFDIPDSLWDDQPLFKSSRGDYERQTLSSPVSEDNKSSFFQYELLLETERGDQLHLPCIESFAFGQHENSSDAVQSSSSSSTSALSISPLVSESDIWDSCSDIKPAEREVKYLSWENFHNASHKEPSSVYISEAGPEALDAIISSCPQNDNNEIISDTFIHPKIMFRSLFLLGLGKSSVLFTYDELACKFSPVIDNYRVLGYSLQLTTDLIRQFKEAGNNFRKLQVTAEGIYKSSNVNQARICLANVIKVVLGALESYSITKANQVRTFLQILQLFRRPWQVLRHLKDFMECTGDADSNEIVASNFYLRLLQVDHSAGWLRPILLGIFERVCKPWLGEVADWVGLGEANLTEFWQPGQDKSFLTVEKSAKLEEGEFDPEKYSFHPERLPSFISERDGLDIFEIGKNLQLLKSQNIDTPYLRHKTKLEWKFRWDQLSDVFQKGPYEHMDEIHLEDKTQVPDDIPKPPWPMVDFENESSKLSNDSKSCGGLPDELFDIILKCLENTGQLSEQSIFDPPLPLTQVLSIKPILRAQAHFVNSSSLRLLFGKFDLRGQLNLQRSYQLFGDGVFVSNLASALFDPNLESVERQRGSYRSGVGMGLKLGNRKTWPPASSELRLALAGILSESYVASHLKTSRYGKLGETPDPPGKLSFAVRTLSDREADKCLDADSLYALDFLRLSYTPPSPINAIITPSILVKYDDIFRFLLRLSRVQFVVSQFFNYVKSNAITHELVLRFRLDAQSFIMNVSHHFYVNGISEVWNRFEQYMNEIEDRLHEESERKDIGKHDWKDEMADISVEDIRQAHDRCIDQIRSVLMLRHQQQNLSNALEAVFETVLIFYKAVQAGDCDSSIDHQKLVSIYVEFKERVRAFLVLCKAMATKIDSGKKSEHKKGLQESFIQRLLTIIDIDYFVK